MTMSRPYQCCIIHMKCCRKSTKQTSDHFNHVVFCAIGKVSSIQYLSFIRVQPRCPQHAIHGNYDPNLSKIKLTMGYKNAILFGCSVSCVISYFQESVDIYLKQREISFNFYLFILFYVMLFLSTAKQGDYRIGSVRLSVCLFVLSVCL